jgi:hypothetical protein
MQIKLLRRRYHFAFSIGTMWAWSYLVYVPEILGRAFCFRQRITSFPWQVPEAQSHVIDVSILEQDPEQKAFKTMDDQIDRLEKRKEHLTKMMEDCAAKAKAYLKQGNKQAALRELQLKKRWETEKDKVDTQMTNMYTQRAKLSSASTDARVYEAIQDAGKTTRDLLTKSGGIDTIDRKLDEIHDTMEDANEISHVISGIDLMGNEDVDDELQALMKEVKGDETKQTTGDPEDHIEIQLQIPHDPIGTTTKKPNTTKPEDNGTV